MLNLLWLYIPLFLLLELLYFKLADKFNIIDKPNERSSHHKITIRGAGIIFPIAFIVSFLSFSNYENYWPLIIGTVAISIISFLDDVLTLKNKYRLLIHFFSVALLLIQSKVFDINPVFLIPAFILVVGVINAYNFMDGINGIHVLYSIVTIGTLFLISEYDVNLFPQDVFVGLIASLVVFAFFNLRKKAKCFSGDIGSISIAFILSFLIIELIIKTEDFRWILLLGVYGIDSVGTIILRLIRKENIFVAHRSHFYQHLANERKVSHVYISIAYAIVQFLFNGVLLYGSLSAVLLMSVFLVSIYILLRLKLEGSQKLFIKY
jgi:UDP-N-acetylmuramyl pentapeptide phosphotransferase/UDP-N-acetylglucosamine-1-phosphate transferase